MGCKEIFTDLGIAGSEKYMGLSEHVVYHRMVVYGTLNEETDEQPWSLGILHSKNSPYNHQPKHVHVLEPIFYRCLPVDLAIDNPPIYRWLHYDLNKATT